MAAAKISRGYKSLADLERRLNDALDHVAAVRDPEDREGTR